MQTAIKEVKNLLEHLPEDCTFEGYPVSSLCFSED
jgi:hypothetical protein